MHWAAIVFGWPAAFAAIGVSTIGLLLRRAEVVLVGALVGLPFMSDLYATPRFWPAAVLASSTHFGAAIALAWRSQRTAWLLFAPTPFVTWYVLAAVTGRWW